MANMVIRSRVEWDHEGVRSIADMNGKKLIIDEPKVLGGTDLGPNPVELILAALGSCLVVLAASLAPDHQVEFSNLKIELEGDLDPDGYMEKNPDVRVGYQEIRYRVLLDSPSEQQDIQALLAHVERLCPVKDTLAGVPIISF